MHPLVAIGWLHNQRRKHWLYEAERLLSHLIWRCVWLFVEENITELAAVENHAALGAAVEVVMLIRKIRRGDRKRV
jgi:hypothetical protein